MFKKAQEEHKEPIKNQDTHLNGIGPYEFIDILGSGKFSQVLLSQHKETGQRAAVKVIDKRIHDNRVMSRLVREVTIMEIVQHPSIVKLYETFETCDSLFLVMEYVPGWNLDEYLKKQGPMKEEKARLLFRQLVTAVDFCHRKWVVHRDLKTPNVLVTPKGQLKLADFGLGNRYGLERLKTICGSMLYYSPEIITGQKYYGPEVDCWCLGVTLFRMTAGFEPFSHAHTVGELKRDVCKCNFPMPKNLSLELQATIRKCLQVDRRKRMTLRQALKDDPWLTDLGKLSCPVSETTMFEQIISDKDSTKRQTINDFEMIPSQHKVKKTVFYHPTNFSYYYTSNSSDYNEMAGPIEDVELLRSELLQTIRSRVRMLGIQSMEKWDVPSLKSIIFSLNSRESSFKQAVKRITRDQVYRFQIANPTLSISRTSSLSSSSTASSSFGSTLAPGHECADFQNPVHLKETMGLLKLSCQLMGISYLQTSSNSLSCVLTLRTPKKPEPTEKRQHRPSQTSSRGSSSSSRYRLSLPIISNLTSSLNTSIFQKNKKNRSKEETSPKREKQGLALFTIQIEDYRKNANRFIIRFSRTQGSNSVFKMAGGWIAGVMSFDGKVGH